MKPFLTIAQQVELLQSRGLVIANTAETSEYLLSNNYYNIINGYGKYFTQGDDNYNSGATFEEISRLYMFDKEMKQVLLEAILTAEAHLKAIFAYRFAEAYQDMPYPYLNVGCYDSAQVLTVAETIAKLSRIISKQQRIKSSSIYNSIKKYNNVPVWILVNYIDFGELRHMLASCNTKLQNKVSIDIGSFIRQHMADYGLFSPETMMSFIANMNDVRNICAHNNRLLDYRCRRDSKYWQPLHSRYDIGADDERSSVYSVFLSLQCFLSQEEYARLHNTIRKRMTTRLQNNLHSISPNRILNTLGFPNDWFSTVGKLPQGNALQRR